ncbi:MAG TPA: peptidase M19, partial [Thermoanaerobaculia bacterium]|nr:peptidase M19 [Thermoanaerobaculia bacterium]
MSNAFDRRRFLALSAAAAGLAAAPRALARQGRPPASNADSAPAIWAGYDKAIVIDALGGPGSANREDEAAPLGAAEIADARASGVTAANVTVGPVGAVAGAFEETVKQIAYWEREIDTRPDALMKVKSAADLAAAKSS